MSGRPVIDYTRFHDIDEPSAGSDCRPRRAG